MASNAESRPDLRTTLPLAAKTLIRRIGKPRRSWLITLLTTAIGLMLATLLLEVVLSSGSATALAFEGELRSRLIADYGPDPIGARIRELRLSIVDEVFGGAELVGSGGGGLASAPVPTVTPEPTQPRPESAVTAAEPTPDEAISNEPGPTATPNLAPTNTAPPELSASPTPTEPPAGLDCSMLYFEEIWFRSDDEIRARVRNDLPADAFLSHTLFEWPDVPVPAYVDYFGFNSRYYQGNDHASPTTHGSWQRLRDGRNKTWRVDFDDEPDEGLYGFFRLTLKFEVPDLGGNCIISASLSKPIPPGAAPTETPTHTPVPPTPTPTDTESPEPTHTPEPATETPEPTTETPDPSPTPTEG